MVSIMALPKEQVSALKVPVIQRSFLTSQANKVTETAPQLVIRGQELYEAGQFSEAAEVWQQAAEAYAQVGDADGITQSWINTAEALQALGFYPRACNTLLQAFDIADIDCRKLVQSNENQQLRDSLLKALEQIPNNQTKTIGLRSLGDVLQKLDDLELSQQVLQLSLNIAQKLRSLEDESAALLSLGNIFQAWGNRTRASQSQDIPQKLSSTPWRCTSSASLGAPRKFYQQAADFYQQAATESVSTTTWVQAQINRLNMLLETNVLSEAKVLSSQIKSKLKDLPPSRTGVYAQLNLASTLACLKQANVADAPSWKEIAQNLATAAQLARSIDDQRTESYAQGYLGGLYAQAQTQPDAQNLGYAQDLTQQALTLAQAIKATDITYLWQWQLGYLRRIQGDNKGAIAAYTQAVETLQSLRSDLSATSRNVQFSFQERVEPVYRQLVDLLLQTDQSSQKNLKQARDVLEALQVAELENLLRCNLQATSPVSIEREADSTVAVIYPIILDKRIEVILSLSGQPLCHYSSPLPQEQNIEDLLQTLRESIQAPESAGPGFLKSSQLLYDWLLRPVEAELKKSRVKTLVFVLDGALRQIPMAALHDGQHYLIEKYAVALSPSLQLLQPKPLADIRLKVLAAGISQKIPGFDAPALPEVQDELEQISEVTTGIVLRDQEFTRTALEAEINQQPFSVVHLATHGQFSSNPDQTYIRAWDERIDVNQLRNLLQTRESTQDSAIELLVLSACDTASSDRRSALGLAGVAVRAGARSTLASLWQVSDDSTASLMTNFYQTLSLSSDSTITKAQALQSAQLEILHKKPAPFQWAGFVLVGNWL
jgi:CHAT domain-containing protein